MMCNPFFKNFWRDGHRYPSAVVQVIHDYSSFFQKKGGATAAAKA